MHGASYSPGMASGMPPSSSGPIAAAPTQIPGVMGPFSNRPFPWALLALISRGGGFLFLFIGTLVAVLFASLPANCLNSTCGAGVGAGVQYGILVSRLFWTLGAFGLSAGAAIKLHFMLAEPSSDGAEANTRFLAQRRAEFLLFLVGVTIMLLLLLTASTTTSPIP